MVEEVLYALLDYLASHEIDPCNILLGHNPSPAAAAHMRPLWGIHRSDGRASLSLLADGSCEHSFCSSSPSLSHSPTSSPSVTSASPLSPSMAFSSPPSSPTSSSSFLLPPSPLSPLSPAHTSLVDFLYHPSGTDTDLKRCLLRWGRLAPHSERIQKEMDTVITALLGRDAHQQGEVVAVHVDGIPLPQRY